MNQTSLIVLNLIIFGTLVLTNIRLNSIDNRLNAVSNNDDYYPTTSHEDDFKQFSFKIQKGMRYIIKDSHSTDTVEVSFTQNVKLGVRLVFNSIKNESITYEGKCYQEAENSSDKNKKTYTYYYVIEKKVNIANNQISLCNMELFDVDGSKGSIGPFNQTDSVN